jgi:nitroimidazol reductase NimA-like FMN-containing flavoprotein (pyridoxamine 5'-phosphate oxidase superfamily)
VTAIDALVRIQEKSFARADEALRSSWPSHRAMSAAGLHAFLEGRTFCVLATTSAGGRPQARPVAFTVFGDAFWFATVAGGRLRNVRRTPWVSVVISDGERNEHRMVAADGPVTVHAAPPADLLEVWQQRMGSRPDWASAWIELRPARLYSYTSG